MNKQKALSQLGQLEKFANATNMRLAAEEWDADWKILVTILMSAQARDEVTIQIAEGLYAKFPTPKDIARAPLEEIQYTIKSLNYFRNKGKYIHELCKIISETALPYTMEELIQLPGVGRKTANVFLVETNTEPGIAIDTHVYRVSRHLGWTKGKTPEKVEQDLMKLFPIDHWHRINNNLVRFAKHFGRSKTQENEILEAIANDAPVESLIEKYK